MLSNRGCGSRTIHTFRSGTGLLFLLAALSTAFYAADPVIPKYDPHTESKLKGTIEDITLPPAGHEKEIVHLLMKNADAKIDIYLCPKSFLDDMGVTFAKGDEITITGSKVKEGDADLFLAKQADKGTDSLILRDDKGNPVWTWNAKK
jgi:hypothetical protein